MNDHILLGIIIVSGILALGFGIWAGLGYPGMYDKYEKTGRVPRASPFEMLIDWIFGGFIR
jgi:hypothetical protein